MASFSSSVKGGMVISCPPRAAQEVLLSYLSTGFRMKPAPIWLLLYNYCGGYWFIQVVIKLVTSRIPPLANTARQIFILSPTALTQKLQEEEGFFFPPSAGN